MAKFNVSESLDRLADKLDRRHNRKHRNRTDELTEGIVYKHVPVVGGWLHLFKCYRLAKKYNNNIMLANVSGDTIGANIIDIQKRKARILEQVDMIYREGSSKIVNPDARDVSLLLEVCESYSGVKLISIGENKFTVVVNKEESIL